MSWETRSLPWFILSLILAGMTCILSRSTETSAPEQLGNDALQGLIGPLHPDMATTCWTTRPDAHGIRALSCYPNPPEGP